MRRFVAVLLLGAVASACAAQNQQAAQPPAPLANNGYALTSDQVNRVMSTCRAQQRDIPFELANALCSCLIRETPRWVPRDDMVALGNETDRAKSQQLIYKNRPMRHVMAICFTEAMDGPAGVN
jgi:hypothetical protein